MTRQLSGARCSRLLPPTLLRPAPILHLLVVLSRRQASLLPSAPWKSQLPVTHAQAFATWATCDLSAAVQCVRAMVPKYLASRADWPILVKRFHDGQQHCAGEHFERLVAEHPLARALLTTWTTDLLTCRACQFTRPQIEPHFVRWLGLPPAPCFPKALHGKRPLDLAQLLGHDLAEEARAHRCHCGGQEVSVRNVRLNPGGAVAFGLRRSVGGRAKRLDPVTLPAALDYAGSRWQLSAVAMHSGHTARTGHWTAYRRDIQTWVLCDDAVVRPCPGIDWTAVSYNLALAVYLPLDPALDSAPDGDPRVEGSASGSTLPPAPLMDTTLCATVSVHRSSHEARLTPPLPADVTSASVVPVAPDCGTALSTLPLPDSLSAPQPQRMFAPSHADPSMGPPLQAVRAPPTTSLRSTNPRRGPPTQRSRPEKPLGSKPSYYRAPPTAAAHRQLAQKCQARMLASNALQRFGSHYWVAQCYTPCCIVCLRKLQDTDDWDTVNAEPCQWPPGPDYSALGEPELLRRLRVAKQVANANAGHKDGAHFLSLDPAAKQAHCTLRFRKASVCTLSSFQRQRCGAAPKTEAEDVDTMTKLGHEPFSNLWPWRCRRCLSDRWSVLGHVCCAPLPSEEVSNWLQHRREVLSATAANAFGHQLGIDDDLAVRCTLRGLSCMATTVAVRNMAHVSRCPGPVLGTAGSSEPSPTTLDPYHLLVARRAQDPRIPPAERARRFLAARAETQHLPEWLPDAQVYQCTACGKRAPSIGFRTMKEQCDPSTRLPQPAWGPSGADAAGGHFSARFNVPCLSPEDASRRTRSRREKARSLLAHKADTYNAAKGQGRHQLALAADAGTFTCDRCSKV